MPPVVGKDRQGCRQERLEVGLLEESHEPRCGLGISMMQWAHENNIFPLVVGFKKGWCLECNLCVGILCQDWP